MIEYEVPVEEDGSSPLWCIKHPDENIWFIRYEVCKTNDIVCLVSFIDSTTFNWVSTDLLKNKDRASFVSLKSKKNLGFVSKEVTN